MSRPTLRIGLAAAFGVAALGGVIAASPVAATSPDPTTPDTSVKTTFTAACSFAGGRAIGTLHIDPSQVPDVQYRESAMPQRPVPVTATLHFEEEYWEYTFGPARAAGAAKLVDAGPGSAPGYDTNASVGFAYLGKPKTPAKWPASFADAPLPEGVTHSPTESAYVGVDLDVTATIAPTSFSALGHGVWTFDSLNLLLGLADANGNRLDWKLANGSTAPALAFICRAPSPEFKRMQVDTLDGPGDTGVVTPTPTTGATPTPQPTPTGLDPNQRTPTPPPTATATPPTPATPTPTPTHLPPTRYDYAFPVTGSATLKNVAKGSLPLTGKANLSVNIAARTVSGDLALAETTGNLVALGFLPVTAKVGIAPITPVAGTLASGQLEAKTSVRIKLPQVSALGIPLAGGANCQTKNPTQVTLKSAEFFPATGGTLTGAFAISDLAGCGFLTGLVSPLTSGSGNAIALKLGAGVLTGTDGL